MSRRQILSGLLTAAVASAQCVIPDEPPLSNTITEGFGILIQAPTFPFLHNRYYSLFESGGGDQHLYLSPEGDYAFDLVLNAGVIEWGPLPLRAVIQGEVRLILRSSSHQWPCADNSSSTSSRTTLPSSS